MISIVIPCYNDQATLPRAISSVLNQRYSGELEIVIVDDGSDEPVADSISLNRPSDVKIRIIRHETNLGLSAALNTCVKHSRGDRFTILASDDALHPEYFARMAYHDADVVSCDMLVGGSVVKAKAPDSVQELMERNCHSYAALAKIWTWEATGGFKAMDPSWEDWCYWLGCKKIGATWEHVPVPLHIYHRRPDGRDAEAQGKDTLLWAKMMGFHQDLYGLGRGLVTFVVPCYKHEAYVAEAVQSALDQTYPHVNVVVVDDGSPGDVAKELEGFDDRVQLIKQGNRHLSGARNSGIMYALQTWDPEFLVMLDADDGVHPDYVEILMTELCSKEYLYTDVQFSGDAYHVVEMEDYECTELVRKHLHPCTFLAPSQMWRDIVAVRGYGYDEDMKEGYEDWEYSLAGVEVGWCGRRVAGAYFNYRFHEGGSMRTAASKINGRLVGYIKSKHPWMLDKELVMAGCRPCGGGGGRFTSSSIKGGMGSVFIPNIGEVMPTEILEVKYTGNTTSTMKKLGAGGQIYNYSGDPAKQAKGYGPVFTIKAVDAHLFVGPYIMRRLVAPQSVKPPVGMERAKRRVEAVPLPLHQPPPVPVRQPPAKPLEVVEVTTKKRPVKLEELPVEQALGLTESGKEFAPEDFTQLKYVGMAGHKKLAAAGFTVYDDVAESNPEELAMVLGTNEARAEGVRKSAIALIKELEEEEE